MNHKKSFRAFACLLLALLLFAQSGGMALAAETEQTHVAVDLIGRTEGYSAVLYDNTNGLPTSEANDIAATSDGFLWIGSYSGLIRYDGNTFERLDSTTGLASVVSLYVDSQDRLWIGTNDSGVALMEKGSLRMWGKPEGLRSASVRAIAEDENGLVYIATTAGLALMDGELALSTLDDPRLENAYIQDLQEGPDGLIYGITQEGAVFSLKNGRIVSFLGSDEIRVKGVIGFMPDPLHPGCLYLGGESTEVYYGRLDDNFETLTVSDIAPLSYVEHFGYMDGKVWICAGDGIGILDEDGFHKLENLPMNNSVARVMTDYEGNLWFASTRQGVMKIVPNQFADLFELYRLPTMVVNSTCMYGDRLFLATDTGLTVIDKNGRVDSIPLREAVTASGEKLGATDLITFLGGCRIRSINRDSAGRLWISTWRKYGLLRFDGEKLMSFDVPEGLFSNRLRTVYERRDGSILAVNTGGVSVIEGDRVTASYGEDDGIDNTEILTVTEADNGDLILGSDGGGIYVIGKNGTKHIGVGEGLKSEVIMRIRRDPLRELYWIVTSNSLAYMTADYQVTTVSHFPYSNNFDLYENSKGEMWVLASNGVYVLPTEDLLANGDIRPVYYGQDNGLPCIATANSYSELTDAGTLYIAGTTGVARVNIETPFENVNDLKVTVPYVEADGVRVYPDEGGAFRLASNVKKLTVYSYVFNYALLTPQVSCWLDGFEQPRPAVSRKDLGPVDYTNLRGGTYHFIIEVNDAMGRGNKTVSVEIVKEKAFYEQVWFYVAAGLLALLLLNLLTRYLIRRKTRALEKKQRESMLFISEITEALARVIDMKDKYTNGHSNRVARYTAMLARELGYDEETVEKYYRIALLHDIGKIGVPTEVLNKPGKLSEEEFEIIKSHTSKGYDALRDIAIMPELATGAQSHHERPDGKGYPNGLKGEEIPRAAQIIAVADCFDAMYSNRPYRKRMNFEKVVDIIKDVSGTQLTADVVDAFLRLVERGELRDPEDDGGGTTENIVNIK